MKAKDDFNIWVDFEGEVKRGGAFHSASSIIWWSERAGV